MRQILLILFIVLLVGPGFAAKSEASEIILDDFDDGQSPNDFFGSQDVWTHEGGIVTATFDSTVYHGGNGYSWRLDYDLSSSTTSASGWWEQLGYSYLDPDHPTYDISKFEEFRFWIKGSSTYTDKFYIEFVEWPPWKAKRIEIAGITNEWQEKTVNLSSLSELDLTQIMQVAVVLKNTHVTQKIGTLYFDDLYFVDFDEGYTTDDEFLELISRRTFKYFLDMSHPETGLIRDTASNREVCSIAGVGFGLTALGIGAERGWISREEAASRTSKILSTLYNGVQGSGTTGCIGYKGFFYHMLDISTSVRDGTSELSSIDTALLLAGVLFVKEYFNDANSIEGEIRELADNIYNRVDWDWMLDKDKNQFYMEWKPENGGGFANHWNYYTDEAILISLLAIGSGKVDPGVFYKWKREKGTYNCYTLYQSWWGSLFTHFFAHCWIKFKELGYDNHPTTPINWWENSILAAKANRQFCVNNSDTYKTYGANSWGLSACFGPMGYNGDQSKSYGAGPLAEPPPNHDGTIPPYGAGSSIVFFSSEPIQNESVQALKNYYENYPKLWGLYGFRDAYNLGTTTESVDDWYAHEYVGIDQGPMLIMIENYRSGLVWKYFMQNEWVKDALNKIFPNQYVYYIKGKVKDSGGKGIKGVEVTLSGYESETYYTKEDGYYEFLNIPFLGCYKITPSKPWYKFEPSFREYNLPDHNYENQDFGFEPHNSIIPINNLFNPAKGENTTIIYKLAKRCHVIIGLYDLLGESIITLVDEDKDAGSYSIDWFGKNKEGSTVASGTYLLYFKAGDYKKTEKIIVIK